MCKDASQKLRTKNSAMLLPDLPTSTFLGYYGLILVYGSTTSFFSLPQIKKSAWISLHRQLNKGLDIPGI